MADVSQSSPVPYYVDAGERAAQHRQFFEEEHLRGIRAGRLEVPPVLIDCGANIGTVVHWFKTKFPDGRVTALEPDPVLCQVLRRNAAALSWPMVSIVEAAAWVRDGSAQLVADNLSGSRLAELRHAEQEGQRVDVQTVDLRRLLGGEPVTLLKLDVEGAEVALLQHCKEQLAENVSYVHVEVHELEGSGRAVSSALSVLEEAGFEHHISPLHVDPQPFQMRLSYRGVVNALAVFAWKPALRAQTVDVASDPLGGE